MIEVEATVDIAASPDAVLGTVMDVDRYRAADHKLRRVLHSQRDGNVATVTLVTRLRGVPAIARQRMVLTPGEGIDVTNVPGPIDRVLDFHGSFRCRPGSDPGTTTVTHAYRFAFKGPLRPLADRYLTRWLEAQIAEEVDLLAALVEGRH